MEESGIDLFISLPFSRSHFSTRSFSPVYLFFHFSHIAGQPLFLCPPASLSSLSYFFTPVSVSLFIHHLFRGKNKTREPESIWTCCGMPFGTLNGSQPWAAICATLCHRGTALGHRQWHTNHPPIQSPSRRERERERDGRRE